MPGLRRNLPVIMAVVFSVALVAFLVSRMGRATHRAVRVTIGEVEAVHPEVRIGSRDVRGTARLSVGELITTGQDGRGRIRLDDGTTVVLDRSTSISATPTGVALEAGRIFVQGGVAARTEVTAGPSATVVASSALAFARSGSDVRIYCANGEAVVRAGSKQERVRGGETAAANANALTVAPEKAFDDWTGGMAKPWGAGGRPRGAIGELWGRLSSTTDEAGSPLAIRSHEVEARIEGESAITRVVTTYFNGGSFPVRGDFRMAIPQGGIVSRFALQRGESIEEGAVWAGRDGDDASLPRLEWAGAGWVRGAVPSIGAGDTVAVIVEYVEWLSAKAGKMSYRYPMVTEGAPPLVGELRIRVDASGAHPSSIAVGSGARVEGAVVELRRADARPEADLVVELEVPALTPDHAIAYVASAGAGDRGSDPYVLVRTELPAEAQSPGVTLAIVLDTSWSMAPALLDAERALIEALIAGLGAHDRVAVLAADQHVHPVGPEGLAPIDEPRRKAIREGLAKLRPGGASDFGAALEHAADALPADSSGAMVVYVGDGWPTVGDPDFEAVRARLARRAGGVPRLGAVAVGPVSNRFGLAALVRGSGPVIEIADRGDAASAAVTLLAGALEPAVDGVELDLGPTIDRVYPRGAHSVSARDTAFAVGRVRGGLPQSVVLRYRQKGRLIERVQRLELGHAIKAGDVRRRWAAARVEDIVLRGESVEGATDIAVRAQLLTPWTGWYIGGGGTVASTPMSARVLDLSLPGVAWAARLATPATHTGALLEPVDSSPKVAEDDFHALIQIYAKRTLDQSMAGVRRCRDTRATVRPEISGTLRVRLTLDGAGHASHVSVQAVRAIDDDGPLDRCVQNLIEATPFFDSGTKTSVNIQHDLVLPPARGSERRKCSATSFLPLPLRRGIWRERLKNAQPIDVYIKAKQGCELSIWADQRALLELLLEVVTDGPERIRLAAKLEENGESDAATHLRRAAISRASSTAELDQVRAALIGEEPKPGLVFEKQFKAAANNEDRLAVVRRFLKLSPHDGLLRRSLFALLEAVGQKDPLLQAVLDARDDPFADAGLLADGASALRRMGRDEEGQRAFGELVERAPNDPYARAYVGDRLRDEGLFDEATAAYEALALLLPGNPAATLRLALAHAGAGRLDVATRVLDRVAQTGGRADDTQLGELASMTAAALLADARTRAPADAPLLDRRALELPLPDVAGYVLVRAPVSSLIEARASRKDFKDDSALDWSAPSVGIFATRIERGTDVVRLHLRRKPDFGSQRPATVRVQMLLFDEDRSKTRYVEKQIEVEAGGKVAEVRLEGGKIL
jgi:tetratricopeptide (TPR) repeat protein